MAFCNYQPVFSKVLGALFAFFSQNNLGPLKVFYEGKSYVYNSKSENMHQNKT